jgi:alpha-methylacyl-CoA racemase
LENVVGPLSGIRIIELAGIGPGPLAAMVLGDLGADIIRVDRINSSFVLNVAPKYAVHTRNRRSIAIDLRKPEAADVVLRLVAAADGLIDPFRPGVVEGLGIGPQPCLKRNPKLVYGRITGWGQDGPLADRAGHDINYIALAGVLGAIGRKGETPVPPLNLVADYGGGGMLLAVGMLAGLIESMKSGRGQVVDAAMIDGAALLLGMITGLRGAGLWSEARGTNLLDSGAHFYEVYETKDSKHVAVGAIEPQFYAALIEKLGLAGEALPAQMDRASWPAMKSRFATIFKTKTRDEWCTIMDAADTCVAPVLSVDEAPTHPHARARGAFIEVDGAVQPAPAPRFSRTPSAAPTVAPKPGAHTNELLTEAKFSPDEIAALRAMGAVA